MRNKGVVIVLTLAITFLCLFYLQFTLVSRRIQQEAVDKATDKSGNVDLGVKQRYLDSLWNKPVYNLLGAEYTYKEVKENELGLGLDLQGGMHVVLEVSPVDIIRGLSNNPKDPAFNAVLQSALQEQRTSQGNFVDLFYTAYKAKFIFLYFLIGILCPQQIVDGLIPQRIQIALLNTQIYIAGLVSGFQYSFLLNFSGYQRELEIE